MNMDELKINNLDYNTNYQLEFHTRQNLLRLVPNTKKGRELLAHLKILLIIKNVDGDNICLKGALLNRQNNEILLMSSINRNIQQNYPYRMIKSHDNDYKICNCKMIAPLIFFEELKNRILN